MGARRVLIDSRTKLKNSIRGFLKAYGIRLGTLSHKLFPAAVRDSIVTCGIGAQAAVKEGRIKRCWMTLRVPEFFMNDLLGSF